MEGWLAPPPRSVLAPALADIYIPYVPTRKRLADKCGMYPEAAEFVMLWLNHPEQRRTGVKCDNRLVKAAQAHAEWLAQQRTEGAWQGGFPDLHIGEGGSTANERIRAQGYDLPEVGYEERGNQVESISIRNPEVVGVDGILAALLASEAHRVHLLGDGPFFEGQTRIGVGFAPPVCWVILSAHPDD